MHGRKKIFFILLQLRSFLLQKWRKIICNFSNQLKSRTKPYMTVKTVRLPYVFEHTAKRPYIRPPSRRSMTVCLVSKVFSQFSFAILSDNSKQFYKRFAKPLYNMINMEGTEDNITFLKLQLWVINTIKLHICLCFK